MSVPPEVPGPRRLALALCALLFASCDLNLTARLMGRQVCGGGETVWKCDHRGAPCFYPYSVWVCARDEASVFAKGKDEAFKVLQPAAPSAIQVYACTDTGKAVIPEGSAAPRACQ